MLLSRRLELPTETPPIPEGVRAAAVAGVIGPGSTLLLIRRAQRAGDIWSGHLAFPGGRYEEGDPSLLHTAIRETREELGFDLTHAEWLGVLPMQSSPKSAPGRPTAVVPYIFRVNAWPELFPNEEVAATATVPFAQLVDAQARASFSYTWQQVAYPLPCVDLPLGRLWGMTLRMVDDLAEALR